jgi:hypothetical protein
MSIQTGDRERRRKKRLQKKKKFTFVEMCACCMCICRSRKDSLFSFYYRDVVIKKKNGFLFRLLVWEKIGWENEKFNLMYRLHHSYLKDPRARRFSRKIERYQYNKNPQPTKKDKKGERER